MVDGMLRLVIFFFFMFASKEIYVFWWIEWIYFNFRWMLLHSVYAWSTVFNLSFPQYSWKMNESEQYHERKYCKCFAKIFVSCCFIYKKYSWLNILITQQKLHPKRLLNFSWWGDVYRRSISLCNAMTNRTQVRIAKNNTADAIRTRVSWVWWKRRHAAIYDVCSAYWFIYYRRGFVIRRILNSDHGCR